MSIAEITSLMQSGIQEIFKLIAPPLILALIMGLVIAIFQATTSIQEQTLTFLPKLAIILLVIGLLGGWMFTDLGEFTKRLFTLIPDFAK